MTTSSPGPGAEGLRDLLAKVEAAPGPDREIDGKIWELAVGLVVWMPLSGPQIGVLPYTDVPALTANLDAAMALAEVVLPPIKAFAPGSPSSSGWKINLYRGMTPTGEPHALWECCIRPHAGIETWHRAPTAALAVLCALLAALGSRTDFPNP